MAKKDINGKPFDEGTLTKLELFQLYTREWLPVFVAGDEIIWPHVHIFDFFCGSGTDTEGVAGSAVRTLEEVRAQQDYVDRATVSVTVHLYDNKEKKVSRLREEIDERALNLSNVTLDVCPGDFVDKFREAEPVLKADDTACLVILDQYGIKDVTHDVFRTLVACPTTDVLFFISSSILRRLNDHPNIGKYLDMERAEDSHDAHRAVAEHYRSMVPAGKDYYVAPLSIKKGSNVYGVIFGTAHPKGMEKFLRVAWKKDSLNGEANFDINPKGSCASNPRSALMNFGRIR